MSDKRPEREGWVKMEQKLLKSNSLVFTYLRSIVSSQCAGWADMLIGFALFSWIGLSPLIATMAGAICGGIINCIINYKFTFRAQDVDLRAVAVKYIAVWVGSMLLNSYGTQAVYVMISHWEWLADLGFNHDGYYAAARLSTSLAVSWFWNFVLQRYFVYRSVSIDRHIISALEAVGIKRTNKNGYKRNSQGRA